MNRLRVVFFLLVVVSSCILATLAASSAPQVSEEFLATIRVTISDKFPNDKSPNDKSSHDKSSNATGSGVWAATLKGGKLLRSFDFGKNNRNSEMHLKRYDLKTTYDEHFGQRCVEGPLEGTMPAVWGWLSQATHSTQVVSDQQFSVWSLTKGFAKVSLYLNSQSVPSKFVMEGNFRVVTIDFVNWANVTPPDSVFAVPKNCRSSNQTVGPHWHKRDISRATIMSRAQSWVDAHVPYSESNTYEGYRTDCSGYVSMAWEAAQPGYTTYTLPQISYQISASELQPGDILLCQTEHVVIFGGWASANEYYCYEETCPGTGTIDSVAPYPYWYNTDCFLPFRYNSVSGGGGSGGGGSGGGVYGSCSVGGAGGLCISTSACSRGAGSSHPGYCPGPDDIQCCTSGYGACSVGTSGLCISTSACSSGGGTSHPGYCPGPDDIQCCT